MNHITPDARVRLALVTFLHVALGVLAGSIFDRFVWMFAVAPILVVATVILTVGQQTGRRVVGIALAVAATTGAAAWSVGGTPWTVAPIRSLRQILTTEWPSPATPELVGVVALGLSILTSLAATAALVRRWRLLPLTPWLMGSVATIALAAPIGPQWWYWALTAAGCLAFALLPHGNQVRERAGAILGERSIVATLTMLGIVAIAIGVAAPTTARSDPRQLDEPTMSAALVDPVEAVVGMRQSEPTVDIYRIENRSQLAGPSMPSHWRVAALSEYDGQRWSPASALRPIGGRLTAVPLQGPSLRPPLTYTVQVLTDRLDLLPVPGQPLTVSDPVNTDIDRVVIQLRERPTAGRTIEVSSLVGGDRSDADNSRIATRPVDEIAGTFSDLAIELAGDSDELGQLTQIESVMREDWQLDPSNPGSGQQQALMQRFLRETRRGTREQFATGFALLARSLGYDSRVVVGFILPASEASAAVTLTSAQAAVWPEVLVTDVGWIRFDPTPPRTAEDQVDDASTEAAPSPAAPQPPIAPPGDQLDPGQDVQPPPPPAPSRWAALRDAVERVALTVAIVGAPVVLALGAIVVVKWYRRRRRLRHPDPAVRVRAAWANTTDCLVDAGIRIAGSDTNRQIAAVAVPVAPDTSTEMSRLADLATAVTFGDPDRAEVLAEQATYLADSVRESIGANLGRWARAKWLFSLRSLLPKTRSPVVP